MKMSNESLNSIFSRVLDDNKSRKEEYEKRSLKSCNSLISCSSEDAFMNGRKTVSSLDLSSHFVLAKGENRKRKNSSFEIQEEALRPLLFFHEDNLTKTEKPLHLNSGFIISTGSEKQHNENENKREKTLVENVLNFNKTKEKNICFDEKLRLTNCFNRCSGVTFFVVSLLLLAIGLSLFAAHIDFVKATASWKNVEGKLPLLYMGSMMVVCSFVTFGSSRYPNKYLILVVLILSVVCIGFCVTSLTHLIGEVNVNLNRLENCWFNPVDQSCTCYVRRNLRYKPIRFAKVAACSVVKEELKQLLDGVTVLFGIGFFISITAAVTATVLLYKKFKCSRENIEDPYPTNSIPTQTEESAFISGTQPHASSSRSQSSSDSMESFDSNTEKCCSVTPSVSELEISSLTLTNEFSCAPPSYQDAILSKHSKVTQA